MNKNKTEIDSVKLGEFRLFCVFPYYPAEPSA